MTAEERAEFVALRHALEVYSLGCKRQADIAFRAGYSADSAEYIGKSSAYQHAADRVAAVLAKVDGMARTS